MAKLQTMVERLLGKSPGRTKSDRVHVGELSTMPDKARMVGLRGGASTTQNQRRGGREKGGEELTYPCRGRQGEGGGKR